MKPSTRILEICEELRQAHGTNGKCEQCGTVHHQPVGGQFFQEAVVQYLDEQYEAEQIAKCPYDHEKSPLPCNCGFK